MKLEMNFTFDTEFHADGDVMKQVCAVLAGSPATTVVADAKEVKAILVPDKVVAGLKEKIVEAVKAEEPAETQAPVEEVEAAPVVDNIDPMLTTEEDMMKASSDTLLKILKGLKIDPNATEGKNTNAKLRRLILDWRKTQVEAPATSTEDEDDDAPASTEDAIEPMSYEDAKAIIEPFYMDMKKRPAVQKLMIEHGAKKVNADKSEVASLGALKAEGKDYRPLVDAIKSFKYDK